MEPIDVTSDPVRSAVAPDPVRSERLLRATTDEAVRLLGADGALVYLLRPTGGLVYLLRPGIPRPELAAEASAMNAAPDHWLGAIRIEVGAGMLGVAVAQRRVVVTGSYRDDPGFGHTEQADTFASEIGLQSLIVAPLVAGEDVFGALGVYRRDADAFGAQQVALVRALADHAALAMANARLIAELDRARLATTRQADVERSLRELGTRISGASDLAAVVQHTIDEAQRLLGGDGGRIDTIDRETNALRGIYTSGREISEVADWPYDPDDSLEVGVSGRAVITARTSITPDYLADTTIVHGPGPDSYARAKGIRSVISSPLVGEDGVFGAITVWSIRADAFDADDASLLETIAGQGAVALVRARLIEDLGRSREELARRVDEERALYDLARRSMMASGPAGPAGVLADVAGVAARLLGPLGAVIDVTGPAPAGGATHRVAGADGADGAHVAAWRAETGDEAIARAIAGRHVVTGGSRPDGAGPVRSWAVAPLIGESAVWGTITVFSGEADRYETGDTELLGALADHATIALAGADLVGRLEESDDRYRSLIENLPDLVFTCAADGTLTFLSESAEALLGRPAKDLIGMHFRDLVSPRPDGAPAGDRFQELMLNPTHKITTRFELITAFGFNRPVEVTAAPIVRDGRFAGIQGSARDIGERERLERELRESDARYRYLVESSPDLVWMTDADGRLTYLSDRSRPVVGWDPAELIGRSFADLARTGERRAADTRFSWLRRHPTEPHRDRIRIVDRDGVERLVEVTAIGMLQDGVFVGAHGAARDIRELVRLEADLRRQAAELAAAEERAHLARELHDSVTQALFSMTLQSRSLELLLARDPGQLAARIGELRDLQRDALAEMRALIFELRPGNVVEHGVVEALRTHAAGVSARLGLPIVVESDLPVRPAIETEEALYRIAQEALHNIVKHAGAREARVELVRLGPDVRLRVVDDGHGFDPDAVPDGHLGAGGDAGPCRASRGHVLGGVRAGPRDQGAGHGPERPAGMGRPDAVRRGGRIGGHRETSMTSPDSSTTPPGPPPGPNPGPPPGPPPPGAPSYGAPPYGSSPSWESSPQIPSSREPAAPAGMVLGIILVVVGALFLALRVADISLGSRAWPLWIIVPGLAMLLGSLAIPPRSGLGLAVPGAILATVGAILWVQEAYGLYGTWAYAWALVAPTAPGVAMLLYGGVRGDRPLATDGLRTTLTGIGLFLGFGLFFEGVIGISGHRIENLDQVLPYAVIGLGVLLMVLSLFGGGGSGRHEARREAREARRERRAR